MLSAPVLVAVLGILSGCQSLRDLECYCFGEAFGRQRPHGPGHPVLQGALGGDGPGQR